MRNLVFSVLLALFMPTSVWAKSYSVGMTEDRLDKVLVSKDYLVLEPPILSMLQPRKGQIPLASLFLAATYEGDSRLIEHHDPLIRDRIITFLTQQHYSFLRSARGQRIMLFQLTQLLRETMYEEEGQPLFKDLEIIEFILE